MKKAITFLAFGFLTLAISAQETFEIPWQIGTNGSDASVTIEVGDTVRWIWGDPQPHTVSSIAGSQEDFDSGTITGEGMEYEFTFSEEGTNDYECQVHPGTMFGTITVETVMSVDEKFAKNISVYPNPSTREITIFSLYELDTYQLHNVLGARIKAGDLKGRLPQLDLSSLNDGVYFLTLHSGSTSTTVQIIKK
ncbi:T9SS type A sorting domain-containing protein [Luteirhabdus pelagi]|uniref:T9SS type A sorting domain-containing protein n=1 Tax=Luteirhabdus pelagi TaxID=2792783 RepID=UPI001939DC90|nr:T9SS type A sorting domain-containing protein [Luteirhabdus pelagi]